MYFLFCGFGSKRVSTAEMLSSRDRDASEEGIFDASPNESPGRQEAAIATLLVEDAEQHSGCFSWIMPC